MRYVPRFYTTWRQRIATDGKIISNATPHLRESPVLSSQPESERYADLSRQYMERADEYLAAGDAVQASEKG